MSHPSHFHMNPAGQGWLELPDGKLFFLNEHATIGRQAGNQLVLSDHTLSRQHAQIRRTADGHEITDRQSRNGTFVAGQRLTGPAMLHDGTRIQLGSAELRFRCLRRMDSPDPDAASAQTTQVLTDGERRECWLAIAVIDPTAAGEPGCGASSPPWQEWIAGVRPAIEHHAGLVSLYWGDAILAHWPCDSAKPDDVLASLRALDAWRARSPLPFRVALHHGTVLFSRSAQSENPAGSDVTFVFQMRKIAPELHLPVMLSLAAVRSLRIEEGVELRASLPVEGMAGSYEFFGIEDSVGTPVDLPPAASGPAAGIRPGKAVFLSYASQDAEAARRLCAALRDAGVEVWLDQSELRGGDIWDEKIRRQIKACALFVPLVSANSQARREGYFRLEWKLAAQRTHAMVDGTPFLLPAAVDATPEPQALVPAEFRSVQWTQLQDSDAIAAFAHRVRELIDSLA